MSLITLSLHLGFLHYLRFTFAEPMPCRLRWKYKTPYRDAIVTTKIRSHLLGTMGSPSNKPTHEWYHDSILSFQRLVTKFDGAWTNWNSSDFYPHPLNQGNVWSKLFHNFRKRKRNHQNVCQSASDSNSSLHDPNFQLDNKHSSIQNGVRPFLEWLYPLQTHQVVWFHFGIPSPRWQHTHHPPPTHPPRLWDVEWVDCNCAKVLLPWGRINSLKRTLQGRIMTYPTGRERMENHRLKRAGIEDMFFFHRRELL